MGCIARHLPILSPILWVLLAVPLAAEEPSTVEGQPRRWNGFFQVREHFPLTTGYLVLEPVSGFTLPRGAWELEATLSQSNTFSASQVVERELEARTTRAPFTREMFDELAATDPFDQTFYLDAQVSRLALRARRGLGDGWEVDVLLPLIGVHGGRTDVLVEGFHDLLGFDQEGREKVTRDRVQQLVSGQGLEIDLGGSGLEPGDLVLGLKRRLAGDVSTWAVLAELDLKLPTGASDALISSGGADVGLSFVGSRCWKSRCGHAMVGYVFAGAADALPTESQALFSTALAFEQAWSRGWGLTVQAQYWQSYLDDLGFEHFAEDTIQLGATAGKATGWGRFYVGLSENSFSFKNSSDVTFHAGWKLVWE